MIFETERLVFREFSVNDAEAFYRLNNDPVVMRYTGDIPFSSVEESKTFIENYSAYKDSGYGRWTTIIKDTAEIIGWCGLKKHTNGMVDLGYRYHQEYWNKGYATEAAIGSIQYGFNHLDINEIVGRTARNNAASVRVLEKCGMSFWKEAPCEGIENSLFYRIIR